MALDQNEIIALTEQYGGAWALNHTRRLLRLVEIIAEGQPYDTESVWLAAHLHDWGAYPPWAQAGVEHALRSLQVAEPFLRERGCPEATLALVLECIATHHRGDPTRSREAILLSDADGLDFLGAIGILRDFSKTPRELRKAYQSVLKRREQVPPLLRLPKSKELAAGRLQQMDAFLKAFEENSFGFF